jgi:hypothetical protein
MAKVAFVAPGHCTGEPTFTALKKTFGDRYLYAGLGTTFALGATPRAILGSGQHGPTAVDEDDLESYRTAVPLSLRLRLLGQRGAAADAPQAARPELTR